MAIQLSTLVRNRRLNSIEIEIGATAILKIYSGVIPADCAASITGTTLVTMTLPSDWLADAASGSKAKAGTWEDTSADAAGTATHFRIFANDGTTCGLQGTVGQGSGDLSLDNTVIAAGQDVVITAFQLTDANS